MQWVFNIQRPAPPPNLPRTRERNSLPACGVGWGGGDVLSLRIGTHYATDIPTDAREFPVDAVDVPTDARDIPIDARDIPVDAGDIPVDAEDIPADIRDIRSGSIVGGCRQVLQGCWGRGAKDAAQARYTIGGMPDAHETQLARFVNRILHGDCRTVLTQLPDACVDLIITSPPYADQRKHVYGGIHPDQYVEWFLPIAAELKRVLKPTGSFVLNIKERVVNGERHTYVLELILAMRQQGWLWTEEYIWHKKNCYPGKWPNRFRDAWERLLHFTKQKQFKMFQEAVMVPMGEWRHKRLKKLGANDLHRFNSRAGSGFGKRVANWIGREYAYPTNVLHMPTECYNRYHAATFPVELPAWFIKLFTEPGDIVLDPFMGSGTTAIACIRNDRRYIGIELVEEYVRLAEERIAREQASPNLYTFAENGVSYES
jgi:site-specific DNA-methyltransferase (adenine-specific)